MVNKKKKYYLCKDGLERSVCDHHLSSFGKPCDANGDPRDEFFYPILTLMIDSYSLLLCLQVTEDSVVVYKGCQPEVDSYSAFWDNNKMSQTELVSILAKHRVTDVFLCGVAYDVCVGKEKLSVYLQNIFSSEFACVEWFMCS